MTVDLSPWRAPCHDRPIEGGKRLAERSVQVVVAGRVQGVGFRAFVEREAARLGLAGWVRNLRDGSVEAVFSGEAGDVEAMLTACRQGPRSALVTDFRIGDYAGPPLTRFSFLPTE
jgi:acylphosphatase